MPYNFKGLNLNYETYGSGDTALLFIHGLFGDLNVWKYQVEHFSDRYFLVAVDLFGHGLSAKDVDPVEVPRTDAEAIVALMREIGKPYYAIGHSFASAILPEIIKLESRLLKGAVFVDCTYQGDNEIIKIREKFSENMLGLSDDVLPREAEYWYDSLIGEKAAADDIDLIFSSFKKSNYRWMFESVAGVREYNRKYLPTETPIRDFQRILIMEAGTGIGLDFRKSWVNHFKNAEYYLFENAGHFFFITQRDRFNQVLDDFLNEE